MNIALRPALPIDTRDAHACTALIAGLPLTNAGASHRLETLRTPLAFLQGEFAKRYAARPLPPTPEEREAFGLVLALWQAMARAYAQVAQQGGDDARVQENLALICQRCVHYAGKVILECYRARREPAPGAWIDLHGYFATAEEWGIDKTAVSEPLNEVHKRQSPAEAYAAILLVDLAGPYSRGAHEFAWICRWARRFAPLTSINPLGETIETRAFGIDLMADASARPLDQLPQGGSVRHFDTRKLAPKLQKLLASLKKGTNPAVLGLGEDCPPATAPRLLLRLYKPWCLNATPLPAPPRQRPRPVLPRLRGDPFPPHRRGVQPARPRAPVFARRHGAHLDLPRPARPDAVEPARHAGAARLSAGALGGRQPVGFRLPPAAR